jgi:hypothetical protein
VQRWESPQENPPKGKLPSERGRDEEEGKITSFVLTGDLNQ